MLKNLCLFALFLLLSGCNIATTTKTKPVINFSLSTQLQPLNDPLSMPPLQGYAQIRYESYLIVVGGNFGGIHDFDGGIGNNQIIYWLNLDTNQLINSFDTSQLSNTDIKNQLSSIAPEFVESDGFLYYIGGSKVESIIESSAYIETMPSVVRIDIPGLTNAVFNNNLSNINQYFSINYDSRFQVTGGNATAVNNYYYLAVGQNFSGVYQDGNFAAEGVYNPNIVKFQVDNIAESLFLQNVSLESTPDINANRRRDTNLWPVSTSVSNHNQFIIGAGPFRPQTANVYTTFINVDTDKFGIDPTNSRGISVGGYQPFNQYNTAHISMYSAENNLNYLFDFGGASVNYINSVYPYNLIYDALAPFSDLISALVGNNQGYVQYYQDTPYTPEGNIIIESTPVYLPHAYLLGSRFYPINDGTVPLYPNGQINLDLLLSQNSTQQTILLGYIYGGIISTSNDAFIPESSGFGISKASNNLYKVYMNLNQSNWKTIN